LFAGVSLEGTVLIERKDTNKDFYGSPVPARDILAGRVPPPEVASKMYEIIEAAEGLDDSQLPEQSFIPGIPLLTKLIRVGGPFSMLIVRSTT
jgi:hypothetical protein